MNNLRKLMVTALNGFTVLIAIMAYPAHAVDALFKAELVEEPCMVVPSTEDQTVDFREIPVKNFYTDAKSLAKPFSISLEQCDLSLGKEVIVSFTGSEDSVQSGLVKNAGSAVGFAIAITTLDNKLVPVNSGKANFTLEDNTTHTNHLDFKAYVQAQSDLVTSKKLEAGNIKSTVTFGLEYP